MSPNATTTKTEEHHSKLRMHKSMPSNDAQETLTSISMQKCTPNARAL
jgi:hypothetical protein